jgi:hypothetical protein
MSREHRTPHLPARASTQRRRTPGLLRLRRAGLRRATCAITVAATAGLTFTGLTFAGGPASAASLERAASVPSQPPPSGPAAAAAWLATQFDGHPYIPGSKPNEPDYSDTAQAVLALAASGTQTATVSAAMGYLRSHVAAEITTTVDGKKVGDPGAIAFLILDAHATGGSARVFGGVNLVDDLLATMRTTGSDAGLFGASEPTYDGAYRQGLSLAALAGVDTSASRMAPAVAWLERQQCTSGGWEAYRADTSVACTPRDPKTYSGPDTNSTALAAEGLEAAGATLPHPVFPFLLAAQDTDGGWGYYGGPSDPDSTAVVIQGLDALHRAHDKAVVRPGGTPQSALRGFQITSGDDAGAFFYPSSGAPTPNLLSTEQAVPALEGLAFPFVPAPAGGS